MKVSCNFFALVTQLHWVEAASASVASFSANAFAADAAADAYADDAAYAGHSALPIPSFLVGTFPVWKGPQESWLISEISFNLLVLSRFFRVLVGKGLWASCMGVTCCYLFWFSLRMGDELLWRGFAGFLECGRD